MKQQSKQYSLLLIAPALAIYGFVFLLPAITSVFFSFTDWSNLSKSLWSVKFTGIQNFLLIFQDDSFKYAIINTPIFTIVTTLVKTLAGLLLALALNMKLKTTWYLRTVFYYPVILSVMITGLLFSAILKTTGPLNTFLDMCGLEFLSMRWLTDRHIVMWSIMMVDIWKYSGLCMVIFLAGLQTIPTDYYEASQIDGANSLQKLMHITIPLLMPSITLNIVNCIIGGLKVFDIVFVLTNGGPGNASQVISGFVYSKFGGGAYGMGTAATLLQTIIICVIAVTSTKLLKKREVEL